jgi:superfamily II DNA/RNA helicase
MLRRRATEVRDELPRVIRQVIDVEQDRDQYAKLMEEAMRLAKGFHQEHAWSKRGRIARDIDRQSRMAAGLAKVDAVVRFIVGLIEGGERPLIFAWHHAVHERIAEGLAAYKVAIITGKQTTKQKNAAKKRFMNGGTPALLLSLRTAAGIDGLQRRATCVVMAELDWAPAVFTQCETRVARLGVSREITEVPSFYCVSEAGFDQVMLDVLGLKVSQFCGIMDDEAETAEDRRAQEDLVAKRILRMINQMTSVEEDEKSWVYKNTVNEIRDELLMHSKEDGHE